MLPVPAVAADEAVAETFWVAGPLVGHLPQIIQACVIESWLQGERQS